MTGVTELWLEFGDSVYRFHLPMAQISEIERRCGKSICQLHEQMEGALGLRPFTTSPLIPHMAEVIRCAVIGGGRRMRGVLSESVSEPEARQLVADYVYGRPFEEYLPVAWAVLNAAIFGRTPRQPERAAA